MNFSHSSSQSQVASPEPVQRIMRLPAVLLAAGLTASVETPRTPAPTSGMSNSSNSRMSFASAASASPSPFVLPPLKGGIRFAYPQSDEVQRNKSDCSKCRFVPTPQRRPPLSRIKDRRGPVTATIGLGGSAASGIFSYNPVGCSLF